MARRSNSTPPASTESEGGSGAAEQPATEPLEQPAGAPASETPPPLGLLEQLPDENPRPGELAQALGDSSSSSSTSSSSSPSSSSSDGYRRPDFKRWSTTRAKKATRKELVDRLKELEGIAETTPPPAAGSSSSSSPEAASALPPEQLVAIATASLTATFRVVSGIGARMRGDHWKLTDAETEALAGAWAPVIAPHLGQLVEYLPVVGAVAVTAEVLMPRIERDMQLAKAAGAESLPVSVAPAIHVAE